MFLTIWRGQKQFPEENKRVLVYVEHPDGKRSIKITRRINNKWQCKDTVLAWTYLPLRPEGAHLTEISKSDYIGFWNPVSEILPPNSGPVLVTCREPFGFSFVQYAYFDAEAKRWPNWPGEYEIVAWMQLPAPYRG